MLARSAANGRSEKRTDAHHHKRVPQSLFTAVTKPISAPSAMKSDEDEFSHFCLLDSA
jgi:hypothetical protein